MSVPFATGDELRAQLRGSDCLRAEAAVCGESEAETLERIVQIAECAKTHWTECEARRLVADQRQPETKP